MIRVSSIETLGTHEGPGVRFVVFTQGCNIRCVYCHNPETWELGSGKIMTHEDILKKIQNNISYYKKGGFTVSGGEPLLQSKSLLPLFKLLKKNKIHTCIDTNGTILNDDVKQLLKYTDLVLLDIKHMDKEWHKKVTKTMSDVRELKFNNYLEDNNIKFWIRYVLVPGFTDQDEYIEKLGKHFKDYKNLERIEVLPFHSLATKKYSKLDINHEHNTLLSPTKKQIEQCVSILKRYGDNVIVR